MKRKLISLFIALTMMITLLSGCGGSSNAAVPESNGDSELVVGVPFFCPTFNPYGSTGVPDIAFIINNVNDYLFSKDAQGGFVPSLCESYEVSPDALTYTFNLRKGVKFSNGEELKASDVKYSLDLCMKSPYMMDGFIDVDSIEIVNDYTVVMHMKEANVSMIEKLTQWYGVIVNEKAHKEFGESYGSSAETTVGTGPYILKEYKSGEYAVFEANEDYFLGAPSIKKVRMKVISDPDASVIALKTGEIDLLLNDIAGISYNAIKDDKKLELVNYSSSVYYKIIMNNQSGMMSDIKLRKAIAYAVDREKVLVVGSEKQGIVVDNPGGPDYTGQPGYGTWYKQDIEKAKQLVKEAGAEGKKLIIKTYSTPPYGAIAISIQDDLKKIGLDVEIQQMERNAFVTDVCREGKFDAAIVRYGSVTKDMDEIMSCFLGSMIGAYNYNLYNNPKFDAVANKGKGELDPEKRKQYYADALKIYTDDAVEIPLYYPFGSRAFNKKLIINPELVQYDRLYYYKWAN